MSNRIAASRMTDRVAFAGWMPPEAPRPTLLAAARGWLAEAMRSDETLSAHLRQDMGLAGAAATGNAVLDFEARRLGF